MNQSIIMSVAQAILVVLTLTGFIIAVAAGVYDLRLKKIFNEILKNKSKPRNRKQPFFTVLVDLNNDAATVIDCIRSIRRNSYTEYEIIIVDNKSADDSRKIVRDYMRNNLKIKNLYLYCKRKKTSNTKAMKYGYLRSCKGDLVLVIEGSNTLPRNFLKNCATRLANNKVDAIRAALKNVEPQSLTGIYYRFWQLNKAILEKFYLSIGPTYVDKSKNISGSTVYSKSGFLKKIKQQPINVCYDSRMVIKDVRVNCDKQYLSRLLSNRSNALVSLVLGACIVFVQSYSIYMATNLQNASLLVLGCALTGGWLLLLAWSMESLSLKNRMELSFCVPFMYFLVYAHLLALITSNIVNIIFSRFSQPVVSTRKIHGVVTD